MTDAHRLGDLSVAEVGVQLHRGDDLVSRPLIALNTLLEMIASPFEMGVNGSGGIRAV